MNTIPLFDLARKRPGHSTGMQNAGWRYDNYPELRQVDAGATIELAGFLGPGVVTCFHITQHLLQMKNTAGLPEDEAREISDTERRSMESLMKENQRITSRGLIVEIFINVLLVPTRDRL